MLYRIRLGLFSMAVGAMSLMGFETRAQAQTITFSLPDITLAESSSVQTGFFNVLVTDSNTADTLNAFDLDVTTSGSQVGFTGATVTTLNTVGGTLGLLPAGTAATYALYTADGASGASAGGGVDFNSSISAIAPPSGNNEAYIGDTSTSNTAGQALSPTTPYGLMQVAFTVPANTVGDFTLSYVSTPFDPINGGETDAYLTNVGSSLTPVLPVLNSGYINVLATPTVTASAGESGNVVGSATLSDSVTLTNGVSPTGTITFTLTAPNGAQTTESVTVSGNGVYNTPTPVTATQVGTYTWSATYNGDTQNFNATDNGGSNDMLTTIKATPVIGNLASEVGHTVGTALLSDTATASGGYSPGGTITFTLTAPNGAQTTEPPVTVTGDGSYNSPSVLATMAGTYTWSATYNGDSQNFGSSGPNSQLLVSAVPEPSSWALAILAVLGGAGVRRFRRPRGGKA